ITNKYENDYAPVPSQDAAYTTKEPSNIMARMYKRLCVEQQIMRNNESCYPNLTKFARDILPILATSVLSEQMFRISGDMITNKRNWLDCKTVREAICLRSWWRELNS
ncbi:20245_t:CDS:2, partial [Cetraspora pellucida]